MRLPPLPSVGDLLRLYRLRAQRQLSQNFLLDPRLASRVVGSSKRLEGFHVIEVGPGPGSLTRAILEKGAERLTVIEKDKRFIPMLEFLADASEGRLHIEIGDVLSYRMDNIIPEELSQSWNGKPPAAQIIGNLPFNVSTPLIIRWLKAISERSNIWKFGRVPLTLTFQKEVAERMAAPVLSNQRCRLSVMCQMYCYVNHRFTIPGHAFVPKPDVDVGVVYLVPLVKPVTSLPFSRVEKVVRCVFSFRQKYSHRGAATLFPSACRNKLVEELYLRADLNMRVRPFQITVEEFARLCSAYTSICDENPKLYNYNARGPRSTREFGYEEDEYDEDEDEELEDEHLNANTGSSLN